MSRIVTVIRPTNPDLNGRGFGFRFDGRIPDEEATARYRRYVEAQIEGHTKALADLDAGNVTVVRGPNSEV